MKPSLAILRCMVESVDTEGYVMIVYCPTVPNKLRLPVPLFGTANALGLTAVPTQGQELWVLHDGNEIVPLPIIPAFSSEDGYKALRPDNARLGDVYLIGWKSGILVRGSSLRVFTESEDGNKQCVLDVEASKDAGSFSLTADNLGVGGEGYSLELGGRSGEAVLRLVVNEELRLEYDKDNGLLLEVGDARLQLAPAALRISVAGAELEVDESGLRLKRGEDALELGDGGLSVRVRALEVEAERVVLRTKALDVETEGLGVNAGDVRGFAEDIDVQASNFEVSAAKTVLNGSSLSLLGDVVISGTAKVQRELESRGIYQNGVPVALLSELQQLVAELNSSLQTLLNSLAGHIHVSAAGPTGPSATPIVCPQVTGPLR